MNEIKLEGLLNSPFFAHLKSEDEKEEFKIIIKHTFEEKLRDNEENNAYYQYYVDKHLSGKKYGNQYYIYKDSILDIVKQVVIDSFVNENVIEYLYSKEDCNKINDVVKKKQYNAKIIKILSSRLSYVLFETNKNNVDSLFILEVNKRIKIFEDDYILKKYGLLKKKIDQITSGVSNNCYLKQNNSYFIRLHHQISEYIYDKHGYNINTFSMFSDYQYEKILEFFKRYFDVDDSFIFSNFLSNVYEYNDIKHVEKIIDYCFDCFRKEKNGQFIYDNKLPLDFVDNIEEKVIYFATKWLNDRILKVSRSSILKDEELGLLYPLHAGFEDKIIIGKQTFENFIKEAYGKDSTKALEVFSNTDNIIQETSGNKREIQLSTMLEAHLFTYDINSDAKKYFYNRYTNFGSDENVLNRFYYIIYLISAHINESINAAIYEYLYDTLNMINVRYNLMCKYTVNNELRDNNYQKLKKILKSFDLEIDDKYKDIYIISLLDRKYATFNESIRFPELEMIGDAIYDLAINEILFYSPTKQSFNKDNLVRAEAQKMISEKIGFDKLYISNLVSDLSYKYNIFERNEHRFNKYGTNYIADSLEMLIGSIYLEFGLEKSLSFTTQIILQTFEELNEPLKLDFEQAVSSNADDEYLAKIFPSLSFEDMDFNYNSYDAIWRSVGKLLMTLAIGTDTKEKRMYITNNLYIDDKLFGYDNRINSFSRVVWYYLYKGIVNTYNYFGKIIQENYNK